MSSFRQQDVITPHFSLPFRFGGINGGAFVNEQDTGDDIVDCIKAIVAYPIGTRADMPEFGISELVYQQFNAGIFRQVRNAIEQWEDRAVVDVDGSFNLSDELLWDVLVQAGVTSDVGAS